MDPFIQLAQAVPPPAPVPSTPVAPPPGTGSTVASTLTGGTGAIDVSFVGMFLHAHPVVQGVMVMLLLASVWSWAIIIEKTLKLRALRRKAEAFEDVFWSGVSLDDLYDRVGDKPDEPLSSVFSGAMREWRRSLSKGLAATASARHNLQARIEQVMAVTVQREMEGIEKRMTFLASTGAAAPFVGLFGTVWGIMTSFQGIAASKNTSLVVVAPGIAEALFATALGLVAAIPAVLAYNKISSDIGRFGQRLENFAQEFVTILSRQLEEQG
ncbi:MAG: protein TolQ [Alphaproteobacteria bacterium]|nr:protein TolQ [Alphaproteobacteria bacterium]